jgi:hypothetical protein
MKYILILFVLYLFAGCNDEKGWSERNKQAYISSCVTDNRSAIGEKQVKAYCECMQKRVQEKYPDYRDADKLTMSQNLEITNACALKGWSDDEKKVFMNSCAETRQTMGDNKEQAATYCDCMMQKIQEKYPDVTKTGNIPNEEMTAMARECMRLRKGPKP